MNQLDENRQKVQPLIMDDPLFEIIQDTPLEDELYSDDYIEGIIEKKYYSTPEIAEWFGINDGQLRYYIKPFQDYLFEEGEETPSSSTAYRLNFKSILKLRMIMLLKDEYRVKGLKRLLGLDGYGFVERKVNTFNTSTNTSTEVAVPSELEKEVESLKMTVQNLEEMMKQMLSMGFFEVKQEEQGNQLVISSEKIKRLESIDKLEEKVEKLQESHKKDIAIRISERRIERELFSKLRAEATEKWSESKRPGLLKNLFSRDKLDAERERYISDYVNEHLNERLTKEIENYHEVIEEVKE
jgi:hypothetical protein